MPNASIHVNELVPFPPTIPPTNADPSESPLQLTLSWLTEPINKESGSLITTVVSPKHPLSSKILTVYDPGAKLSIL